MSHVTITLPNLFSSFLSTPPVTNPHYSVVKAESEAWIKEFCQLNDRMGAVISRCDFAYFMAIAAPKAGPKEFRTLCDWGNWVSLTNVFLFFFIFLGRFWRKMRVSNFVWLDC